MIETPTFLGLDLSTQQLKAVLVNEDGVSTNPLAVEASEVLHTQLPALADEFGVIL